MAHLHIYAVLISHYGLLQVLFRWFEMESRGKTAEESKEEESGSGNFFPCFALALSLPQSFPARLSLSLSPLFHFELLSPGRC